MKHKLLSLLIIFAFIFSFVPVAHADSVTISDSNLKSALKSLAGGTLTTETLAAITGDVDLSNLGISSIDGIQYLTGATSIDLSLNSITTIPRTIENLTSLESLDLSGNKITRIPSNVGALTSLKELDLSANRLEELTSSLSKLSLDTFSCNYNFLDVSAGSDDMSVIDSISATNKYYSDQLTAVANLSGYSPQSGTIILYWDSMDDITFDDGVVGHIARFSVLDTDYYYIGEAESYETYYEITGLDTTTEYTFYVSCDYYVQGTEYSSSYTKLYVGVTLMAVPSDTPTPEPSATETPTPSPELTATPTPSPIEEETAEAVSTDTPTPSATETVVATTSGSGKAGTVITVIIVILAVIFVFVTLLIIMRAVSQTRNRNTRYRR